MTLRLAPPAGAWCRSGWPARLSPSPTRLWPCPGLPLGAPWSASPTRQPLLGEWFIGTAGFHGIDLAAHCAVADGGVLPCRRGGGGASPLADSGSVGHWPAAAALPSKPGLEAGPSPVHKRAAGEIYVTRRLATSAILGWADRDSGGQEDVQSFAGEAADKLRSALRHAHAVTACELLSGDQAVEAAVREPPPGSGAPVPGLAGPDHRANYRGGPAVRRPPRAPDPSALASRLKAPTSGPAPGGRDRATDAYGVIEGLTHTPAEIGDSPAGVADLPASAFACRRNRLRQHG